MDGRCGRVTQRWAYGRTGSVRSIRVVRHGVSRGLHWRHDIGIIVRPRQNNGRPLVGVTAVDVVQGLKIADIRLIAVKCGREIFGFRNLHGLRQAR